MASGREEVAEVSVDILQSHGRGPDGLVWTLATPEILSPIEPWVDRVADDPDAPAIAEVVDIIEKPAGQVVHLRMLPGAIEDYEALVRRTITPA